jgi:hypothetical protein
MMAAARASLTPGSFASSIASATLRLSFDASSTMP